MVNGFFETDLYIITFMPLWIVIRSSAFFVREDWRRCRLFVSQPAPEAKWMWSSEVRAASPPRSNFDDLCGDEVRCFWSIGVSEYRSIGVSEYRSSRTLKWRAA